MFAQTTVESRELSVTRNTKLTKLKRKKKNCKMQEQVLFLGRILSHYSTYTACMEEFSLIENQVENGGFHRSMMKLVQGVSKK